ncbi:mitochondrial chaperone bcs1 [Coprinopsis cinerea AmutBmut pab1-1]|nr:mitochondrial chaperone bcs1 [Coprinopsis cinerea AmutBmut pab1-1]
MTRSDHAVSVVAKQPLNPSVPLQLPRIRSEAQEGIDFTNHPTFAIMAGSLDSVAQQIFRLLDDVTDGQLKSSLSTPSNSTEPAILPIPTSFSITSILTLLLSFSALRNYIKFAFLGTILETARRWAFYYWYKISNAFFINVHLEDDDEPYDWMMVWLSRQPEWRSAKHIEVTTDDWGLDTNASHIEGEEDDPTDALHRTSGLNFIPTISTPTTLWYKGRYWMYVSRQIREAKGPYDSATKILDLRIMAWDSRKVLNDLLREAKKLYKESQENNVCIYTADLSNYWKLLACRPKRPLDSIVLDPGVKTLILDDALDFMLSKNWYIKRGIPFRRGYLLHGPPGTGKTSIIHALAGELGLNVYIISLSRCGMDDNTLGDIISRLPERCIALMEDIDAAFSRTLNRDGGSDSGSDDGEKSTPTSRVSLSGLLNALDGVGAQEGRILFATTNKYGTLDPALTRPGRMDVHVEFKLASRLQAKELYKRFYLPDEEATRISEEGLIKGSEADSPEVDGKTLPIGGDEKTGASEEPLPIAPHKRRAPKLSLEQVEGLSTEFASFIPERELSMASIQGYLMIYKTRPFEAVKDAPEWVVKERKAAALREESEKRRKDNEPEAKDSTEKGSDES